MEFFIKKPKKTNKQIQSMLILLVTIVGFAGTLLVGKFLFSEVQTAFAEPDINNTAANLAFDQMNGMWGMFDTAILFVIIGLTIGLILTSFLIPVHPAFLVINIVGMIALIFISAVLGNVYSELIVTEGISGAVAGGVFDKTTFIMQKLPWICAVIVLLSTIVMYAKGKNIS